MHHRKKLVSQLRRFQIGKLGRLCLIYITCQVWSGFYNLPLNQIFQECSDVVKDIRKLQ